MYFTAVSCYVVFVLHITLRFDNAYRVCDIMYIISSNYIVTGDIRCEKKKRFQESVKLQKFNLKNYVCQYESELLCIAVSVIEYRDNNSGNYKVTKVRRTLLKKQSSIYKLNL